MDKELTGERFYGQPQVRVKVMNLAAQIQAGSLLGFTTVLPQPQFLHRGKFAA